MNESDIRALALFFYFALLDDRKAIELAITALGICQDQKKRFPQRKNSVILVSATNDVWSEVERKVKRGLPNTSIESGWVVPAGVDIGPWREFQKNATSNELQTLIWSRVLKYSDADIALGLGITTGTVRYRLARAFRKLGSMTNQTPRFITEKQNGPLD